VSFQGPFTEAGQGFENCVGGFRPNEGLWFLIVSGDKGGYRFFQFVNPSMGTTLDLAFREDSEPALDLIQP
jgi:hypothetical protein